MQPPETHTDLLELPLFAHFATVRPDGAPLVNPMWFLWDSGQGVVKMTHTKKRSNYRNIQREPRLGRRGDMHQWRTLCGAVIAVLVAAACGNGSSSQGNGPPPHGNVLYYATPGEPGSLDPGADISGFDAYYSNAIYETLINSDPKTLQPTRPGLATSWEFTGTDKLTFRLHLRHGVTFQDGTPFNAQAVKVSLDHYKSLGAWFDLVPVKSETVVDDNTIDLNLSQPYSPLPAILTFRAGQIISPTALQKYGKDYGRNPVGAGPFAFKSWTAGSELVLTKCNG